MFARDNAPERIERAAIKGGHWGSGVQIDTGAHRVIHFGACDPTRRQKSQQKPLDVGRHRAIVPGFSRHFRLLLDGAKLCTSTALT